MKAFNIIGHNGRAIANQIVVEDGQKRSLTSYKSLVAEFDGEKLTLGRDWDYSATTTKYLRLFLEEYVPKVWFQKIEPMKGRSVGEKIRNAIDSGVIFYDEEMV